MPRLKLIAMTAVFILLMQGTLPNDSHEKKQINHLGWETIIQKKIRYVQKKHGRAIRLAATQHGVDPKFVTAIIVVESAGDVCAKSPAGARGLMQLKPRTAKEMGVKKICDPYDNIAGGVRYLKHLKRNGFKNNAALLLAYNRGPATAARLIQEGYRPERDSYVLKVKKVNQIISK